MKLDKKNKLIVAVTGLILIGGATYQNCGQLSQNSINGTNQTKSIFLQGLKAADTKDLTITLKNGMQLKTVLVGKQEYTIKLKDGTQLKLGSYSTLQPKESK